MIDWRPIQLVAFDVDGTLYAQKPLRLRMMVALAAHTLRRRSLRDLAVLRSYRTLREEIGSAEVEDFDNVLLAQVARRHKLDTHSVRGIVSEWMEERPLRHLSACRYPLVDQLFDRARQSGRSVGILSDYPTSAKVQALGLHADYLVSASDVGLLKPHPRGLKRLMELAGTTPEQTILIGDRADRDAAAAQRAGCACLLRSSKPVPGAITFARFDDPIFDGLNEPVRTSEPA